MTMSAEVSWPVCDHCGARIPRLDSLTDREEARVLQLIRENKPLQAESELRYFVGCDPVHARIWVEHRGRPLPVVPGPPCPSCGVALATSMAKHCLACGADWHQTKPRAY